MRTLVTLLLASIGTFVTAFAVRMTFLPHIVPIATVEDAQSLWALEAAFLLKALENIAAFGAVLVIVAFLAHWIARRMRSPSRTSRERSTSQKRRLLPVMSASALPEAYIGQTAP
jgi:hypothetical protein